MNYSKIYNRFIKQAQRNPVFGYHEKHHIVPRCLGGTDDAENIVKLSIRQHVFAHLVLYKIYKEDKPSLIFGITQFFLDLNNHRILYRKQRRMPKWVRVAKTRIGAAMMRDFRKKYMGKHIEQMSQKGR